MKHFFVIIAFVFIVFAVNAQSYSVTGVVKQDGSNKGISKVKILYNSSISYSETDGTFVLPMLSSGTYEINFLAKGYDKKTVKVEVKDKNIDLGKVFLLSEIEESDNEVGFDDELDDESGGQYMPTLLHGSRDAFLSAAAYSFGPMRFRIRGYDSQYSPVYMNGLATNDMESGRGRWFLWSGLNDVVRNREQMQGNNPAGYSIGGIGGSQNISTRPSEQRTGTKLVYSASNRSYTNRVMVTHSTGLMKNGWAITASGSKRWSSEGYVQGTFYDAYGYFLGVEKKINDSHSIYLTAMGTPNTSGGGGASTQEVYDMTGNNYYNPNWGWQDGKKRNAKVRNTHKPLATLNHEWQISERTTLNTGISYLNGKSHRSSLNWYNANDPRPDYYRYLPSAMTDTMAMRIRTEEFENGERQLIWDNFYYVNRNNKDSIPNADNSGTTLEGYKSEFIVENRHDDEVQMAASTVLTSNINDFYTVIFSASHRNYKGSHYKTVNDLLGGDFIVDIDKYAERDFADPETAQSDIRYPNRIVKVGDKFGYNYDANVQYSESWLQNKFSTNYVDFYVAGKLSYTTFWRTGYMQNGKYPENSLGNSEKHNFLDYTAKAGLTFKINGRNYITANAVYLTQAPTFRNAYVSSRTRNEVVGDLKSETIKSIDASYILRSPTMKLRINAYYTEFENQMWVRSFYHDGYRNFVNYAMTGINKTHQGLEFGLDTRLTSSFTFKAAAALSNNRWTSRPIYNVTVDNNSESLAENETVYAKNFLVSGTPQTASSLGLNYRSSSHWFLSFSRNYVDDIYLSFNPTRRTQEAVEDVPRTSDTYYKIIDQEKLPKATTYDFSIGKSFRYDYKYYLSINLNVSNVFNNKQLITGGYEQLRFDLYNKDPEKFQPKYYYYYGRTFFLNVSFRF